MGIRVLVNGAFGRMGQMVTKAIENHPSLELAGQIGREYDLAKSIKDSNADVVVDFTHPGAVMKNTQTIIECGARPVVGTSGLKPDDVKALKKQCDAAKLGGLIAPNFSLGAVLVMKYAREMAKYMPNMEIIEMHHDAKVDSPSGSAMRAAEMLAEGTKHANPNALSMHETIPGARGASMFNIPIHAVRLPGMLAHLQILFGNQGESVTLRHDSLDRQCFMPGVCLGCEKVMTLDHLVYGLEEIL